MDELDNPVWWAMTGSQRDLGSTSSLAARFHPDISPFGGFSEVPTESHWRDLAGLIGPRGTVALIGETGSPPSGWTVLMELAVVQMVGDRIRRGAEASATRPAPGTRGAGLLDRDTVPPETEETVPPGKEDTVPLGKEDADEMLGLAAVARPGPFLPRTVEFGGYFGIRRRGRLVAMAGERLRPPGFAEVSAVATAPDHRRQGLAERVVGAVVTTIESRSETPFLHAGSDNTGAIRLYESMGFTFRRTVSVLVVQGPGVR